MKANDYFSTAVGRRSTLLSVMVRSDSKQCNKGEKGRASEGKGEQARTSES
jgi:hypothetical protein